MQNRMNLRIVEKAVRPFSSRTPRSCHSFFCDEKDRTKEPFASVRRRFKLCPEKAPRPSWTWRATSLRSSLEENIASSSVVYWIRSCRDLSSRRFRYVHQTSVVFPVMPLRGKTERSGKPMATWRMGASSHYPLLVHTKTWISIIEHDSWIRVYERRLRRVNEKLLEY